jgi:hypothetical protein
VRLVLATIQYQGPIQSRRIRRSIVLLKVRQLVWVPAVSLPEVFEGATQGDIFSLPIPDPPEVKPFVMPGRGGGQDYEPSKYDGDALHDSPQGSA